MDAKNLLIIFIVIRMVQFFAERHLSRLNRNYYLNTQNRDLAMKTLNISSEDMEKTLAYTEDKYKFGQFSSYFSIVVTLLFIGLGGLGYFESLAKALVNSFNGSSPLIIGAVFFTLLMFASMLVGLPFKLYSTFKIEEKHGYNKQTVPSFFSDMAKQLILGAIIGLPMICGLLWIMNAMGEKWWLWAWIAMSSFSLLIAWIYPTFLAPIFNKFSPVADAELKDKIEVLAKKIGFKTDGLYVMDASKRSSHGNAYFTGVFGKKRIVLFDTLIESMKSNEIVAVLAHELGHFKLNHVRWQLLRGIAMTGLTFYVLSLCLPLENFYRAFALDGVSNYGALVVFGLWFGITDFILQPLESLMSRSNEFAADEFAKQNVGNSEDLCNALLKLREKSNVMPISHPVYSAFYHSHPPLMERLGAMGFQAK